MRNKVTNFLTKHFSLVLVFAFFFGLLMPGLDYLPKDTLLFVVAALIFFACSKITMKDIKTISVKRIVIFYVLRFVIFPFIVYGWFLLFAPFYARSALLLTLMPAGSAAPGVVSVMRGNVALALSLTVFSILMTPFTVPTAFWLIGGTGTAINVEGIFVTLCVVVFAPIIAYAGMSRAHSGVTDFARRNSSWISTLLIGALVALVVAIQRKYFFENPGTLISALIVLSVLYAAYYIFGWVITWREKPHERGTFIVASGANNNSLAASLALLYFAPQDTLFIVISEVPWVIGIMLFKHYFHAALQLKNRQNAKD